MMCCTGWTDRGARRCRSLLRASALAAILVLTAASRGVAGPAQSFADDLGRLQAEISDPEGFNADSCTEFLGQNLDFLLQAGAETYLPEHQAGRDELTRQTPDLLLRLFALRLTLLQRAATFSGDDGPDDDCAGALRRGLRYGRFTEELLAESMLASAPATPPQPLKGEPPFLMRNTGLDSDRLRSGDLLLTRSPATVSAAIARIGDHDSQFSHLAMLYRDNDGRLWVLESVFNPGAVIVPLEQWRQQDWVRILVLRHRDGQRAAHAAAWLHHWLKQRLERGPIPYDFLMNLDDSDSFYCAELVGFAFQQTASGPLTLPSYPTRLTRLREHHFFRQLGISASQTFAPADAEVEPQLQIVLEWRDLTRTARSRIQDAILSRVLDWLVEDGYHLTYRGFRQGLLDIYWHLLRPLGLGQSLIPANMPRGFLKTITALDTLADLIYREVAPELLRQGARDPLALDYKRILAAIDDYRQRDCRLYLERRRWFRENLLEDEYQAAPARARLHELIEPGLPDSCPDRRP